jgi:hypothetical protein
MLQLDYCDAFLWLKIYISVTFHSKYMNQIHHKHHFLSPLAFIHCFPLILYLNITHVKFIRYICCVIWIHVSNLGQNNSRMLNCNQKNIMWVFKVAIQVITSSWPYYTIVCEHLSFVLSDFKVSFIIRFKRHKAKNREHHNCYGGIAEWKKNWSSITVVLWLWNHEICMFRNRL